MAYIDHASAFAFADPMPDSDALTAERIPASFSALEWTVIALARNDRLSSLGEPSPLARAMGGLFGLGRQSILADARLEAVRRLAVHAWHKGYQLPVSEMKRFLAEGFSSNQLEALLANVASRRIGRRPVSA